MTQSWPPSPSFRGKIPFSMCFSTKETSSQPAASGLAGLHSPFPAQILPHPKLLANAVPRIYFLSFPGLSDLLASLQPLPRAPALSKNILPLAAQAVLPTVALGALSNLQSLAQAPWMEKSLRSSLLDDLERRDPALRPSLVGHIHGMLSSQDILLSARYIFPIFPAWLCHKRKKKQMKRLCLCESGPCMGVMRSSHPCLDQIFSPQGKTGLVTHLPGGLNQAGIKAGS